MLSNFDPKNLPPKFNPFRHSLIEILSKADYMTDAQLKAELAAACGEQVEKYVPRKATIILKRIH